jgi:hypothetical protein
MKTGQSKRYALQYNKAGLKRSRPGTITTARVQNTNTFTLTKSFDLFAVI